MTTTAAAPTSIAQVLNQNASSASGSSTASGAGSSSGTTPSAQVGLGNDFHTFLTLLTTQLRNQDPLSPLDTNQFTQQLVSFSQVEQAINTNTTLSSLLSLQQADQSVAALPLIGHTVEYTDNQGALVGGQAEFAYNLPSQATSATITITDASGNIVLQQPANTGAGPHTFTWNGKASDGTQAPDGTYTLNVSATAPDQSAIKAAISAFGKVEGVDIVNNTPTLNIGGISEGLSKVVAIDNGGS
jgi:flagellar basal-body rod modification protein FlgD